LLGKMDSEIIVRSPDAIMRFFAVRGGHIQAAIARRQWNRCFGKRALCLIVDLFD